LESKIIFRPELLDVLKRLNNKISKALLISNKRGIESTSNYFDLALPKNDMLSYYRVTAKNPTQKHIVSNRDHVYISHRGLLDAVSLPNQEYPPLDNGTIGTIKLLLTRDNCTLLGDSTTQIAHFISDAGENIVIDMSGLKETIVGNKTDAKAGRVVRKLLTDAGVEFIDKDIEEFVNSFKARVDIVNDKFRLISVLSGTDIKKAYKAENSSAMGQLGNSCMRHDKCQDYLNIYSSNPDVCQLVVIKDEDNGIIRGRALLWTLSNGKKYMDRVYTARDNDMNLLRSYAEEQGWSYVVNNNIHHPDGVIKDKYVDDTIKVTLTNHVHEYYPYFDTMSLMLVSEGVIGTKPSLVTFLPEDGSLHAYELLSTNGVYHSFQMTR
jgi:hypothetical protein